MELEDTRNIIDSMQEKIISIEHELALFKRGEIDHSKYYMKNSLHYKLEINSTILEVSKVAAEPCIHQLLLKS